ncbi:MULTISPECIES: glycosyltransferase family 4 protein [Pseudomonas]|jgi:glycosyltransferase involved in cell wall biosynthesis|uniref:glycosyltransferase family 4 protein n=1 Tax=Pseudomonas TaxID=286 RepID=UPI00064C1671|nr:MULTISPECIES: glycosyltransferase family 4 protein [Pseudomonas]MDN6866106.1 glycosyltransferase family 4 protein [Pseudomonas rhodesiae]POA56020.1 glycosyltransferase WbuB [Pseudomonas sp. GW531-R1]
MNKTFWYITKYFSPKTASSPGGRGWFLVEEMQKAGCEAVVITSDSNNLVDVPELSRRVTTQEVSGVKIVWLKTLKYSVAKSSRRILSWLHFEWNILLLDKKGLPRPDVIVVSSLSLFTILNGLLLRRKYKCRLVFEVRDIWPLTIIEEGGFSKDNIFVRGLSFLEKMAYKKSDAIIGTMPNLAEHVKNEIGHERPVFCIPMGVSEDHLSQTKTLTDDYQSTFFSVPKFRIVHAGTIGITNALEPFFEAAEALKDHGDIEFVMVGDGALKKQFQKTYGHLSNLVFAPKVSRDRVQAVLVNADILYFSVYPSKVWNYGQSLNKVIDYMLAGKPVVASYSGYPSMINEADCGVYVPASDVESLVTCILEMKSRTPIEREEMGMRGRQWLLDRRSYPKLAKDYMDVIFEGHHS